jgi:lysophospholipase L1-like esterase
MRIRLVGFSLFLTLLVPGLVYAAGGPQYYLALGDSLAVGVQPAADGTLVETSQGYPDDLHGFLRRSAPGLRLKKLGCSGETTTTMLYGGSCYGLGSQLQQAVAFLATHRVALITLDIGGDDVLHCFSLSGPDPVCLGAGIAAVNANLPNILTALLAAAPGVPIVAMNYYDPFLAAWQLGAAGQLVASQSLTATLTFNSLLHNSLLQGWYDVAGIPVADVAAAYHITNFTPVPVVGVPLNVFLELTLTWIGAPPPVGPDIHPNALGYAVIAGAFVKTIAAP